MIDTGTPCEGNTQNQILETGTHEYDQGNPSLNGVPEVSFNINQPSIRSTFRWFISSGLEDPNTPDKRYIELDVFATDIRVDLVGFNDLKASTNKVVMVTDN